MSTNISKQKRDDLLNKIREIRKFISTAEQDDNTARLLTYLYEDNMPCAVIRRYKRLAEILTEYVL